MKVQPYMHPIHGKVLFLKKIGYKFAKVKDIDRGPGYCEKTEKYVGVKHGPNMWRRGQNYCFGAVYTVRISELKPI